MPILTFQQRLTLLDNATSGPWDLRTFGPWDLRTFGPPWTLAFTVRHLRAPFETFSAIFFVFLRFFGKAIGATSIDHFYVGANYGS